jgi:NAD(P)-dependent dehydrogenase (short-subunit alcohol dehydrogenase family)
LTLRRGARGVVTGAASGIGAAVARRLLAEGVSTLAFDRDADGLARLAEGGAEAVAVDLADPADRERAIEAARGCHYLVNAAGVIRLSPLDRVTLDEWRELYAINTEAVFFLLQGIAPTMPSGGAIVNLSSTAAKTGTTLEAAVYASTKAAVISLTRSFAYWLADRHPYASTRSCRESWTRRCRTSSSTRFRSSAACRAGRSRRRA